MGDSPLKECSTWYPVPLTLILNTTPLFVVPPFMVTPYRKVPSEARFELYWGLAPSLGAPAKPCSNTYGEAARLCASAADNITKPRMKKRTAGRAVKCISNLSEMELRQLD